LIQRALSPDPKDRFGSVLEMLEFFRAAVHGLIIEDFAKSEMVTERAPSPVRAMTVTASRECGSEKMAILWGLGACLAFILGVVLAKG
jgi:hypothetical protein